MILKTLLTSLALAILFSSCDPNADKQVGNANRLANTTTGGGGGGTTGGGGSTGGSGTGSPTDAPIDGGLGILLLAGTAYGVKRIRGMKQTEKNK